MTATRYRSILGALALAGASSFCGAQAPIPWPDVEGRIQYAYYTSDARALNGVLTSLRPKPVEGEAAPAGEDAVLRAYFRALAQYRLALVLAGKKSAVGDAVDECEDEVEASVAALPKVPLGLDESDEARHLRAENYALLTACAIAGGNRIGSSIEEAVKLEPKNPRVRLLEALAQLDRAGKDAAEKSAAITKLRAVTQMFEAARAAASTTPEWGAAEAYLHLGRALYDQRDVVGAREALERALLIAPEYASARKLMAQITR